MSLQRTQVSFPFNILLKIHYLLIETNIYSLISSYEKVLVFSIFK